jgi:hypothetical protein
MAETVTLDRNEWTSALDRLTEDHDGEKLTIELLDMSFGDQHEVERLPFAYLNFDPKDDVVIVAIGGKTAKYPVVLRHMIWHPAEISVADSADLGTVLRVVDSDGVTNLITFHR